MPQTASRGAEPACPNEYLPGQGISPHVDCVPCFGGTIASVSFLSPCLMSFDCPGREAAAEADLVPGSVLVLSGEARLDWRHGIPPRLSDRVGGILRPRGRRISATFRTVVRGGWFPLPASCFPRPPAVILTRPPGPPPPDKHEPSSGRQISITKSKSADVTAASFSSARRSRLTSSTSPLKASGPPLDSNHLSARSRIARDRAVGSTSFISSGPIEDDLDRRKWKTCDR